MATRRGWIVCASTVAALLASLGSVSSVLAAPSAAASSASCTSGAHSLSDYGDRLYPDTGNGGYTSLHTDVHMVYDAGANLFLAGNHVELTDRATHCLNDLSLDFERRSANTSAGPDMTVNFVAVNGRPARFVFVQPTYPGDPYGQNDPNPAAHEVSQTNPVGGPQHNPLPPACSPELLSTDPATKDSQNGRQCPANKLVIEPSSPLRAGSTFRVTVSYTGRPGVHNDGDGTTEGWFRSSNGSFVTTEPVATEDWMPLNDYPTAKPTYDFYDSVNAGKTAVANGVLISRRHNAPDFNFARGSVTWHWHSPAPIASYLVENSVGNYTLTKRTADNGIQYYEAQDNSISPAQQKQNLAIMNQQQDITHFQSQFNGTYPFTSDGVIVGTPMASFDEEMQTMIAFSGGVIDLSTFYHENMHQWWGDNVSENSYSLTFYKEGFANFGQYLLAAREVEAAAGGPNTEAGQDAFDSSLTDQFNVIYAQGGDFWTAAPSNPTPFGLFAPAPTYARPSAAYIALRQILGKTNFVQALEELQREYGGATISERELEAGFQRWMPNQSEACSDRLNRFFTEWFDTAYPGGGGDDRPRLTGPGLAGPGFYDGQGGCNNSSSLSPAAGPSSPLGPAGTSGGPVYDWASVARHRLSSAVSAP